MSSKRILVTGSEGTLGVPLVARLRAEGHEVFSCDLQHTGSSNYIRADVANFRELERAFKEAGPEVVYHLAAEFGRHNGEGWYERVWTTNAIGTRNVLELCASEGAQLIFASSSEIYGEAGAELLDERLSERVPLRQPNEYALSKWANEVQIRNFAARSIGVMPAPIILRFFNAYGPGETYHHYRSVVALFCYRLLHGLPITVYADYYRTFMFIGDFIPTLAGVHERGKPGEVYNIGGKDYRSVEELAGLVIEETGANDNLVDYLEFDTHNVVSKRPDIVKAMTDLGHDPQVRLEEGIPETVRWMREQP